MPKVPTIDEMSERFDDITAEGQYRLQQKLIKPTDKPADTSLRSKLLWAGLGGLTSLAVGSTIPRLLIRGGLAKPTIAGLAASGALTGFFAPSLHNVVLEGKTGEVSPARAKRVFKDVYNMSDRSMSKVQRNIAELRKQTNKARQQIKTAGVVSSTIKGLTKGTTGLSGAVGKSLIPGGWARHYKHLGKKVPFGVSAFKWGVRGGAVYGGVKGGMAIHGRVAGPRSGNDYTTLLRNNILAGKIKPRELSLPDLASVHSLGLR